MNTSNDIYLLVKKYVSGELDEQGRKDFEAILEEHPELKEEIEFTKSLIRSTEKFERQRLLHLAEKVGSKPGNIRHLHKYWRWAAVVAVPILVTLGLVWRFSTSNNDRVVAFRSSSYIKPALQGASLKGTTDSTLLLEAYSQYDKAEYDRSLALLELIPSGDSLYLYALFLKGHNYYRSDSFEQAINAFEEMEGLWGAEKKYLIPNRDNAGWTRILAMLELYQIEKKDEKKQELIQAIGLFLETADTTDIYFKKAKELQKLLGSG